jgi:hypothetical protein
VQHEPVVVPGREPARVGKCSQPGVAALVRQVDGTIVEEDERAVEPGDHQVLVVARIRDDCRARPVVRSWQVLECAAVTNPQLRRIGGVVELGTAFGTGAVHGVEIERRRAGVRGGPRLGRNAETRRRVEGDVVVDELAEERRSRRVCRVVRVAEAQAQIGDQQHRPLGQVVARVENAALRAEVQQGIARPLGRRRERRQPREDAPEGRWRRLDEAASRSHRERRAQRSADPARHDHCACT